MKARDSSGAGNERGSYVHVKSIRRKWTNQSGSCADRGRRYLGASDESFSLALVE